jgi:general L-amino acid transport system substrate-binding protein
MSYSRRDEAVMRRILRFLRKQGVKVWVDNEKLVPGTPIWEIEIEKAIKNAAAIVVVCSPDSKNSEWVRREITVAERYHKRIFPVLARGDENSSITIRLSTRQYVDIRQDEDVGLNSLGTALAFYLEEFETQERRKREEQAQREAEKRAREKREAENRKAAAEKATKAKEAEERARREREAKIKKEAEEKAVKALEERALREAEEKLRREREAEEKKVAIDRAELKKDVVEEKEAARKYKLVPHGVGAIVVLVIAIAIFGGTYLYRSIVAPDTPAEETALVEPATGEPGDTEGPAPAAQGGGILEAVKARGKVICGGRTDWAGFGMLDQYGNNMGFDIDLCRAVAAAVLGDPEAIEVVPLTAADRGPALQTAQVDMLSRNVSWYASRDVQWGNFTTIMFYDGQGFMMREDSGITSVDDFDGATVCVTSGTTTEYRLAEFFRQNGINYEAVVFEETAAVYGAYEDGRCDITTSDRSQLASVRSVFSDPYAHIILDVIISKEPLTPAVPHGDDAWFDTVKLVMFALINAEELGVTQANVEDMKGSTNFDVLRLLGKEGDWGYSNLGLEADALANAIAAVGNYGEIYDRYMGPEGLAFTLPRGPNELWSNGGLIYAPMVK